MRQRYPFVVVFVLGFAFPPLALAAEPKNFTALQ